MSEGEENKIVLKPIGVVRSPVKDGREMPVQGVPAVVEVFPQYTDGLRGIESNTHLIVIGWLHQASRDTLLLSRYGRPERGVFGLRAPARPNPLGLNAARVTSIKGGKVHLDRLDMIDGTPILDLKRYSPGWDSIFSARTSRDLGYPADRDPATVLRDMLVEAVNFHGESCIGIALGVRIIYHAMSTWRIGKKEPAMAVRWGRGGCINDALQGLSGATSGNGRLRPGPGSDYSISYKRRTLVFQPKPDLPDTVTGILEADISRLFLVRASPK
ncbi:MAG: tRNA (N6-threonylcarbamoyladenosine(37)-N6)-methyltransferase TrmO [Dehalococcoidia bacterium]